MRKNTPKHIAMGVAAVLMVALALVALQEGVIDGALPAFFSAVGFAGLIICERKGWI